MASPSKEARIILALEAIQNDENLTMRSVAKLYRVAETTLQYRRAGRAARCNIPANSRKLTDLSSGAF